MVLASFAALFVLLSVRLWTYRSSFPELAGVAALAVTFFLAEQYLMNVEFRRQSHSLTLAGVPLAVGILSLPTHDLVLARVCGSLAALVIQRISAEKIVYNISAFAFETGLTSTIVALSFSPMTHVNLLDVGLLIVYIAIIDQMMSVLVMWVIRIHGGTLSRRDVADVLIPALVLSVMTTVFGASLRLLLDQGVVGTALTVVLVAVAVAIYRMYAVTARRHRSLRVVHEFVNLGVGSNSPGTLETRMLNRIRLVLRASKVQLMLSDPDASVGRGRHAGGEYSTLDLEDESMTEGRTRLDGRDWIRAKALFSAESTLASSASKEAAIQRWLHLNGVREAIVVPLLVGSENIGALTVIDRLGETSSFTDDDLALLQTLTGHLAGAIQGARLLARLTYDATHDSLTGLANRAQLTDQLARSTVDREDAVVLLLDLDKFKEVNDVLGHDVGDRLLQVIAQRITECVPSPSTAARLGGDEFAVLFPHLGEDPGRQALGIAHEIVSTILRPVRIDEALLTASASIGIAVGPTGPDTDLLRCADTAMYVAKGSDGPIVVYHQDMQRGRAERLAMVADLRVGLETHPEAFVVYYQPKVDIATGRAVSAEALVRWQHPTLGQIGPDRFVPIAEASGLIEQLTLHVLSAAATECLTWNQAGHDLTVAVNLSAHTVADETLPDRLLAILDEVGLPGDRLILEITEGSIVADPERAVPILHRLAAAGMCVSLDDFGTGYSSLSYLQRLPVSELKIDRSFITALTATDDSNAAVLVQSIVGLARNLGLRVVAEGIETDAQLSAVRAMGCDIAQGYLISRPLPAQEMQAWLAAHSASNGQRLHLLPATA